MKLIKSRIPRTTVSALDGNFIVHFVNYQAVVPDAVAAELLMRSDFFSDAGPVADAVRNAKVLVVRDTGLGDVLLTTPLIRKLATEAGASIDVLTLDVNRCLFDGNPHARETFALDGMDADAEAVLFAQYDVVLDLRLVVENAEALGDHSHRADAFAAFGGFTLTEAERRPDLFLQDGERERTARYANVFRSTESGRKGVVGYVWASTKSNRNWSDETHYSVLAALEAAGYGILLIGDRSQRLELELPKNDDSNDDSHIIDLMGDKTLRETIATLSQCDAVITPDTGLFHVAGALHLPTLAYFGAFPVGERSAHTKLSVVNDPTRCGISPCRAYTCVNRDLFKQPICLMVSGQWVVTKLKELLGHDDEPSGPAVVGSEIDRAAAAPVESDGGDNLQRAGGAGGEPGESGDADHPLPDPAA